MELKVCTVYMGPEIIFVQGGHQVDALGVSGKRVFRTKQRMIFIWRWLLVDSFSTSGSYYEDELLCGNV